MLSGDPNGTRSTPNITQPGEITDAQPSSEPGPVGQNAADSAVPNNPRTPSVREFDRVDALREAAEAIRSGRIAHFTGEHRARLVEACEEAAETARAALGLGDRDDGEGEGGA